MFRALPGRGVHGLLVASALVLLLGLTGPGTSEAQSRRSPNFDRRVGHNVGFVVPPTPTQEAAERALRREVPGLAVAFDRQHGVARSIRSHTDYLTGPRTGEPRAIGLEFVERQRELLGLTAVDLTAFEVTDEVFSQVSGATHIYLRQTFAGIPVYHGQLQLHVNRQGRLLGVNNAFVRDLARSVNTRRPSLSASEAVLSAAEHLGLSSVPPPEVLSAEPAGEQTTRLGQPEISLEEIVARLRWLPIRLGDTRLVWSFQIHTPDRQHVYELNVDAVSGEVWTRFDLVSQASYRVYERPIESPQHTTPLPPADARTLVVNPEDATYSPLGWHDDGTTSFNILRGNNVHAFEDHDANGAPPPVEPVCSAPLVCDFPLDLTLEPQGYVPAAVTNLFYWNNLIHDIQARYGFDEAAGNFQETHFGPYGEDGDPVRAEAQYGADIGFNCNARFITPADGTPPEMRMYLCNAASPKHDGDLDDGVIVHEYGHGISNRQVGGPALVTCLQNFQRPSEGWSDWFGLVYTAETGDAGTDTRGLGSYLFNLPPDGTIRPQPYSTDPAVNDYTYETIGSGVSVPHGVGSVWAQALWEVTWDLVARHGFNEDLTDFSITNLPAASGNQRALLYVNEGLKNTACSPTFLDARDGIIQAVLDFDSTDLCPVWQSFANFGLGADATTGGPSTLTATNGFRVPVACEPDFAGPDHEICLEEPVTLGQPALPSTTYLWSTGETTAQITVSPEDTTVYTVTATDPFDTITDSVTVKVADCRCGLDERFEGDVSTWETTGLWHLAQNSPCASPQNGYVSPTHAFYYGQDSTCTYNTGASNAGTLTSPLIVGISSTSTLSFRYLREVEFYPGPYDQTVVEILTENGATTVFYLDAQTASSAVWTSSGPIDLSAFQGQRIRVRFRFNTLDSVLNDFIGWFVDDVVISSVKSTNVTFDSGSASGWTNNGVMSDCLTGSFVVGTPAQMVSFGVLTQPDGDCTSGSGQAFYTAANTSPSIDDVDLGMCVADSPTYLVVEESLATICYFHGQRTDGDDPGGDFFELEVSTNGGPYRLLDSFGDEQTDALWRTKGIWVPSGADVKFRVRVSDGEGPGDIIEGGVDDVMICPFDGTVLVIKQPFPREGSGSIE